MNIQVQYIKNLKKKVLLITRTRIEFLMIQKFAVSFYFYELNWIVVVQLFD
jgi:hypothetical protein